jgi:ATP synthase F0 subunit c
LSPEIIIAAVGMVAFAIVAAGFAIGTTIGDGMVSARAVEAIARQPEARPNILQFLIIGVGFVEANAFIALGLGLFILFGAERTLKEHRKSMFLSLDGTFWIQLINFAIFFAILNVVFIRPVQRAIANRRAYIDGLVQDYDQAQARAAELRAQAEQIRIEAHREADHVLSRERNEAGNEAAKIAATYASHASEIVERAHATVYAEVQAVLPRQDALARELATGIVSRVLPESALP